MGLLRQVGIASVAIAALLVGCTTAGLMDSADDMGGTSSGGGNTVGDPACSACFKTFCAWEVTECAADPECAEWLTCAREAPAGSAGVDGSWLDQNCPDDGGPTAVALQSSLSACLTGTACCEGRSEDPVDMDASPSSAPDATDWGPGALGDGGPEDNGWTCPVQPCQCLDCLYAFKHGQMSQDSVCTIAVQECVGNEACGRFLTGFAGCMQSGTNAAATDQRALEACLFMAATGATAMDGGFQQFMETVYPCAMGACNAYCVVETSRPCIQCQQQWCEAEYDAYLSDGNALLGAWCRSYCQAHPDDGACPGKCAPYLEAGAETLQLYGQCVQTSCPNDC